MNKDFQNQAKEGAEMVVHTLTAVTPIFLVFAIMGVATFNGWLEYTHYRAVIGGLAWIPGFIFAGMRFGSGLGGIQMFKSGSFARGVFFLAVSVGLTFWTSAHAPQMAESIAINVGQTLNAEWFIKTALWVALIGELMIAMYMGAQTPTANAKTVEPHIHETFKPEQPKTVSTTPIQNGFPLPISQNGNGYASKNNYGSTNTVKPIGFNNGSIKRTHATVSTVKTETPKTDMRICQGPNCSADISHKRSDAKYCSTKCRGEAFENRTGETLEITHK